MSSCLDVVAAAFARYADRPCLGESPDFAMLSYAEVWRRAVALASDWAHRGLIAPGDFVGICGFASIDWMVADLACLYRGAVSVPLQPSLPPEALRHVIADAGLRVAMCSVADLARLDGLVATVIPMDPLAPADADAPSVAPTRRGPDAIVNVTYTSGSSSLPRGVVYRDEAWGRFLASQDGGDAPVTVGYLPLCHILGRGLVVYRTLMSGGSVGFTGARDLSTLFADIRAVRPTVLALLPRVSGLIYRHFQTEVARGRDPEAVMAEMRRGFLGDRLRAAFSSGAPTPPEVLAFLERCFGVPVADHYGSTDLGPIATNGRILPGLAWKILDAPELGYTTRDRPYPRGELAIRAPARYFKDAAAADTDGFLRTGDIVELRGPGRIAVVDRRQNIVKLAQGEFVSLARIEEVFATWSPHIAQIFVHGDPRRAFLLAVIVPAAGAGRPLLRAELDRVARAAGLAPHEVPRDFLIAGAPFTVENRLLTEAGKPRRPALRAAHGAALEALYQAIDGRQLAPAHSVVAAIAATLGLPEADVALDRSFVGLGGDSLGAVDLCARLEALHGRAPAVARVLAPTTTVAAIIAEVERPRARISAPTVRGRFVEAADLRVDDLAAPTGASDAARPPRSVLVTGASGFLGRNVVAELRARGLTVHTLVRGPGDGVQVHHGDVTVPRLGLSEYDALAEAVDAVVHGAALVNHALSYRQLFEPNVAGTLEVARFALARRAKPLVFLSSIAAVAGAPRRGPILEGDDLAALLPRRPVGDGPGEVAVGYGTSKWAAELLLADVARATGLPVAVVRASTILPHTTRADLNPADLVMRLLAGVRASGVAPTSFYGPAGPRHFDGVPVDVAARAIAAIVVGGATGTFHLSNDHWDDGVSLDRFVDWMISAGVKIERVAHAAWVPTLRGPPALLARWGRPDAAPPLVLDTTALRAQLGGDVPVLDEAYLHHVVRSWPR